MNKNSIDPMTGIDPNYDLIGNVLSYENGRLGAGETLYLFSFLVRTGQAWTLQGSYGRSATSLIEAGYLDKTGNILREVA